MNNARTLSRVAQAVFCEPWLVTASQHALVRDIVRQHIEGIAHGEAGCATLFEDMEEHDGLEVQFRDGIAVIPVHGTLGIRVGGLAKCSGMVDYLDIQDALEAAGNDASVKGIIMHYDSPGGMACGCPETAAMIEGVGKPVVSFTDSCAASGAYWLAAAADMIVCSQSADVGSIGVYMALLDETESYRAQGLKQELFTAGKYKAIGMPGVPLTDEQRTHLQAHVDSIYAEFAGYVTSQRPDVSGDSMQGQMFGAKDAKASGLADIVGTMADAVAELWKLITP